jgi:phosphoglycolate phosphatase-like HAD superfamily hydrolase
MRPTVLLFDIDGTLVTTGGAGGRAMRRGLTAVFDHPNPLEFKLDGMTDRSIVRQAIGEIGEEPTQDAIDRVLAAYLEALADEIRRVPTEHYRVYPGVRETVQHGLDRRAAVGLGTGNVQAGARMKLEHVGLYEYFRFGGFGCDAEARVELIRAGAARGAAQLGLALSECRVVVIGDTPKDVLAARGAGAECVGVGTGSFTAEELLLAGADHAFSDLTQAGALAAVMDS